MDIYTDFTPYFLSLSIGILIYAAILNSKKFIREFCWKLLFRNGISTTKIVKSLENDDYDNNCQDHEEIEQVPYNSCEELSESEMIVRSSNFYSMMNNRRSVRHFCKKNVSLKVMENIIHTAGTSPSGAHTQPWTFVLVCDPQVKKRIREIIEAEEEINYKQRMGEKWCHDLEKFRTNWIKPYLEEAPYLIAVFKQVYGLDKDGQRKEHYYNEISVSIACGLLLAAIQNAGLVSLISTPLNAGTPIKKLLSRPVNEKLLLLLPVGYPAEDCLVPKLQRKSLTEILYLI